MSLSSGSAAHAPLAPSQADNAAMAGGSVSPAGGTVPSDSLSASPPPAPSSLPLPPQSPSPASASSSAAHTVDAAAGHSASTASRRRSTRERRAATFFNPGSEDAAGHASASPDVIDDGQDVGEQQQPQQQQQSSGSSKRTRALRDGQADCGRRKASPQACCSCAHCHLVQPSRRRCDAGGPVSFGGRAGRCTFSVGVRRAARTRASDACCWWASPPCRARLLPRTVGGTAAAAFATAATSR